MDSIIWKFYYRYFLAFSLMYLAVLFAIVKMGIIM